MAYYPDRFFTGNSAHRKQAYRGRFLLRLLVTFFTICIFASLITSVSFFFKGLVFEGVGLIFFAIAFYFFGIIIDNWALTHPRGTYEIQIEQ